MGIRAFNLDALGLVLLPRRRESLLKPENIHWANEQIRLLRRSPNGSYVQATMVPCLCVCVCVCMRRTVCVLYLSLAWAGSPPSLYIYLLLYSLLTGVPGLTFKLNYVYLFVSSPWAQWLLWGAPPAHCLTSCTLSGISFIIYVAWHAT